MSKNIVLMLAAVFLSVITAVGQKKQPGKVQQPSIKTSIAAGKLVYTQYCLSCHMEDGGGVENMNPPLIKTNYINGDKSKLVAVVLKGISQQEINGETYTNIMASFNFLTDKQVADVLTYVRNSFGNKKPAVTATDVKSTRKKIN